MKKSNEAVDQQREGVTSTVAVWLGSTCPDLAPMSERHAQPSFFLLEHHQSIMGCSSALQLFVQVSLSALVYLGVPLRYPWRETRCLYILDSLPLILNRRDSSGRVPGIMSGGKGIAVASAFFLVVALVGAFFFAPKGPNRGLVQTLVVTACICLYMFYIITYLAQLNPLIGPQLKTANVYLTG